MTHAEAAARADFLRHDLHRHNRLYYEGTPEISDQQFDVLLRELQDLEKALETLQRLKGSLEQDAPNLRRRT